MMLTSTTCADESAATFDLALRVMPDGNTRHTVHFDPYPIYALSGHGCRVRDVDGNEYVDYINNYSSLIHGHCHPAIVQDVRRQVGELISVGLPTPQEVQLAELLCARVGCEAIRFANSGTEAVMLAIKVARAFTGRPKIAKLEGAYHGTYDYAEVSQAPQSGEWGSDRAPNSVATAEGTPAEILTNTLVLPFNNVEAARALLDRHASGLAAVLIDIAPSHLAFQRLSPEFLQMVRDFTRAHGVLLILDEVYSFRYAFGGAQALAGLTPDLTVLGKIIGGGFPIGAVAGSAEVMSVFHHRQGRPRLPHGGTYNANPVTMVAGWRAMSLFDQTALDRLNGLGERLRSRLRDGIARTDYPAQVTGLGSVACLVMNRARLKGYRDLPSSAAERQRLAGFQRAMLSKGLLMDPRGTIVLATPMSEREIDLFAEAAFDVMKAGL